ncbi:Cys-tRNA(Pro) deacylase [Bacillus methanolicus]|uniref:Cys-tRNA(Pro) deacylase n=1 Tax=Bacillus methanolicus TaxID=1471 RepID=UPI00200D5BF8|nr:Cys-tRNA(Pro) deacylase [Bacillus methanolicus]UQD53655.1 Cys-tRNA(Pro) deacylase [Bacillus methanolicus]
MAQTKTNAMRILDAKKIDYQISTYENKDGKIDGVSVAEKINKDPRQVFKTLVAQGTSKEVYVFIIPVAEELDLKKAANAAGEKKVDLVPVKDIQKLTGYIRGGCSPIGMKKHYKTFLEATASEWETIVVSAGKIGVQMELAVDDLLTVTEGTLADLKK